MKLGASKLDYIEGIINFIYRIPSTKRIIFASIIIS
jgi:hypothetical protein